MTTSFIKKHPGRIITALTLTSIAAVLVLLKQPDTPGPAPKIALAEMAPNYHSNDILLPGQERAGEQDNIQPVSQADASMQPINTNGGLLEEGMFGLGGMRPDGNDPSNAIYPEQGNTLTLQRNIDATNEFNAEEDEATLGANPTAPSQPIPLAQQTSTAILPIITAPISQPGATASGPAPVVVPPTSAVEAPPIHVAKNIVPTTEPGESKNY